MTVPISEELNVRERIERLFQTSTFNVDVEAVASCLDQASANLASALSTFVSIEFELEAPDVRAWTPTDEQAATADQVVFQSERGLTGAKFRCYFSDELVEVLVRSGFGGSTATRDTGFDCKTSEFCDFFVSNVALTIVREIASRVTGTRSQNITFEKIIENELDTVSGVLKEAGFLATWQLVMGEARHAISVFLPSTEFHLLVEQPEDDAGMAVDETDASAWSNRMQSSLAATEVQLRAVMIRPDMPLERLSKLQVGDVVEFTDPQSTSVLLECDGEPLFTCEIGQKDGYFAVHVRGEIHRTGSV